MLAIERLAGVPPEVNLGKCTSCMPLPSVNKATTFGFKKEQMSPEVQNRVISGPIKGHVATQNFFNLSVCQGEGQSVGKGDDGIPGVF